MSESSDTPIEALANELIDSLQVDWKKADTLNEEDRMLLKNLNTISQVAQLHESQNNHQLNSNNTVVAIESLFKWGRLEVLEEIGQGSFGQVYRAHDVMLERDVALKLLKDDANSLVKSKTFIEEAKHLAKVRHPNVLAIHGAAIHEKRAGFWSDLIVGLPLNQIEQDFFDDTALIKIIHQVSQGLHAIHQAGIIHGDIKPANIIKDDRGDFLIMDFGAGIGINELANLPGFIHGTPALMAPELFDEKHEGTATDVYALGATLFKICAGLYPVSGQDLLEIKTAHQHKEYESISKLRSDLDKDISNLIQSMVSHDAKDRPSTNQIIRTLYDIETAPQRRRNKRAAWSFMALLIAGTVASSYGFYQADQAKDQALLAQNKAESVNEFLQDMLEASSEMGGGRDVRVADVLDKASDKLVNEPPEQSQIAIEMHQSLANSYNSLRDTEKSLFHAKESISLAQAIFAKDDERLIKGQLELAHSLEIKGDHQGSINLVDEIIANAETTLGSDHWYIQLARKFKITNLMAIAEYDQAIEILDNHFAEIPDAKTASNNFGYELLQAKANALSVKGKFEDAIRVAKQGIAWLDEYPRKSLINQEAIFSILGAAQLDQGLIDEGLKNMTLALDLNEKINGKESVDYLDGLVNLGAAQRLNNQPELAKTTTIQAFELAKQIYGDKKNLRTVGIGTNLANMLVDLGDIEQGEAVMRESLKMSYDVLGIMKPESLILEYNLSELLHKQGRFAEALEYAACTYAKKKEAFGANHPYVFLSQDNIAISFSGLGRHDEAIETHAEAVAGIEAALGAEHQYSLLVKQHQVDSMMAAEKTEQTKALLLPLIDQLKKVMGEDDEVTVKYTQLLSAID